MDRETKKAVAAVAIDKQRTQCNAMQWQLVKQMFAAEMMNMNVWVFSATQLNPVSLFIAFNFNWAVCRRHTANGIRYTKHIEFSVRAFAYLAYLFYLRESNFVKGQHSRRLIKLFLKDHFEKPFGFEIKILNWWHIFVVFVVYKGFALLVSHLRYSFCHSFNVR